MNVPTSENCAREILQMFAKANIRAGEYLPIQFIEKNFSTGRADDINRGLDFGYQHGWLESSMSGPKITQAGCDETSL